MWKEFKDFIAKGNAMDLAVGVIIGAAFQKIVDSVITDLIMPPVGLVTGGADFSRQFAVLKEGSPAGPYASLQAARDAGANVLAYGSFITATIQFLILALVVFFIVKGVNSLRGPKAEEPEAPPPADVALLEEIRDLLKARGA
ncbi:MAG: large conductance mechanosensitive channel protein MscL [Fimbriimonadaceae bacterium]|nr:large conductance mechanosensitive channel protein MscL [Fimbriimonadaceae bacterium]QYK55292.1 MAG: large conductance mechanosensitive channel protein MscL [Fimbriimonadaceae bacterium]